MVTSEQSDCENEREWDVCIAPDLCPLGLFHPASVLSAQLFKQSQRCQVSLMSLSYFSSPPPPLSHHGPIRSDRMRRHWGRNVYGMELVWRKQGQPAVMMQVTDSSVRRGSSRGAMKTHSVYASRDAWTRVRWGLGHTHFQTCRETQACVRCTPQQTAQSEGTSLTSVLLHETEEGGRKRGREGGERERPSCAFTYVQEPLIIIIRPPFSVTFPGYSLSYTGYISLEPYQTLSRR